MTGDLVNVSLDVEFEGAARWLDTLGLPNDVTVVPGNHDAYIRRASGWALQHWGEFMRGDFHPNPPPHSPSKTGVNALSLGEGADRPWCNQFATFFS